VRSGGGAGRLGTMPWPTWEQAGAAAALSFLLWLGLRWILPNKTTYAEPVAGEFALIAALYMVWRLARMLPIASTDGAFDRARRIDQLQHALRIPSELSLQHFVIHHGWLGRPATMYYATLHVPALIAFLVWLFLRHRDRYPHWRNALALTTAGCLFIRFIRVAPPRFLPDLGYRDLAHVYGSAIYSGNVDVGASDQFAAMPSIHVAWAAVISCGIVACSTSRWRWLFLLHLVVTMLVVSATGNHWWLDGIVALLLLADALVLDTAVRRRLGRRTAPSSLVAEPEPAPVAG
jgi:hypothetical protein